MIKLIVLFILTLVSYSAVAAECTYTATWPASTTRADDTAVTGAVTYQFHGGEMGGPFPLLHTVSEPTATGTVDIVGNAFEVYVIACENDLCGAESPHKIATRSRAFISPVSNINIEFNCN